ncbi:MAG: hypothetical protein FJ264_06710 [Planctomycetes bacterium]|nr:hypothetical protein [Planctomycetota bacterium]
MTHSKRLKKSVVKEYEISQTALQSKSHRNIAEILHTGRQNSYRTVNFVMVKAYQFPNFVSPNLNRLSLIS